MSRYIVDIHGEIDGDFDIIGKYVEPTADIVEVVRCKDCKHSEHWYGNASRCFLWHESGIKVFDVGYCSYGERR